MRCGKYIDVVRGFFSFFVDLDGWMQSLAFTYSQQPGELRLRKKKPLLVIHWHTNPDPTSCMRRGGSKTGGGENLSARSKNLLVILKVLKADSYA